MGEAAEKALRLIGKKKYDEAVRELDQAIEAEPDNPQGYIDFGNLLIMIGEPQRAPAFFNKALDLASDSAEASFGLGNACFEQGQYEEAAGHFEQAQTKGLSDYNLYYMIGRTAEQLHRNAQALAAFQRAVELNGEDTISHFQYALALARFGQLDEAEQELHRVIAQDAHHADAYYNLGVLAMYRGKDAKARLFFGKSLEINPRHSLAAQGIHNLNKRQHHDRS